MATREVKFKGLAISSKQWEYGSLIHKKCGKAYIYFCDNNGFKYLYEVYPETVSEFTNKVKEEYSKRKTKLINATSEEFWQWWAKTSPQKF